MDQGFSRPQPGRVTQLCTYFILSTSHRASGLREPRTLLCAPRRRGCGLRPGEGTVLCVCLGGGHCRGMPLREPQGGLGAGVEVLHTHPSPEQCSSQ